MKKTLCAFLLVTLLAQPASASEKDTISECIKNFIQESMKVIKAECNENDLYYPVHVRTQAKQPGLWLIHENTPLTFVHMYIGKTFQNEFEIRQQDTRHTYNFILPRPPSLLTTFGEFIKQLHNTSNTQGKASQPITPPTLTKKQAVQAALHPDAMRYEEHYAVLYKNEDGNDNFMKFQAFVADNQSIINASKGKLNPLERKVFKAMTSEETYCYYWIIHTILFLLVTYRMIIYLKIPNEDPTTKPAKPKQPPTQLHIPRTSKRHFSPTFLIQKHRQAQKKISALKTMFCQKNLSTLHPICVCGETGRHAILRG